MKKIIYLFWPLLMLNCNGQPANERSATLPPLFCCSNFLNCHPNGTALIQSFDEFRELFTEAEWHYVTAGDFNSVFSQWTTVDFNTHTLALVSESNVHEPRVVQCEYNAEKRLFTGCLYVSDETVLPTNIVYGMVVPKTDDVAFFANTISQGELLPTLTCNQIMGTWRTPVATNNGMEEIVFDQTSYINNFIFPDKTYSDTADYIYSEGILYNYPMGEKSTLLYWGNVSMIAIFNNMTVVPDTERQTAGSEEIIPFLTPSYFIKR